MKNNYKAEQLKKNPAILSIGTAFLGCFIIGIIFINRFSFDPDAPMKDWVDTATYFNNAFSPLLLFVSLLLLYRTWKDSKIALELQREELNKNSELFERQVSSQELKDNLEIFSRRITNIDKKFSSFLSDKDIGNVLPDVLNLLIAHEYLEKYYNQIVTNAIVTPANQGYLQKKVTAYIYDEKLVINDLLSDYMDFFIKSGRKFNPKILFSGDFPAQKIKTIILGHALIESIEYKRVLKSLNRLLLSIDGEHFDHFKEELALSIDLNLIIKLFDTNHLVLPRLLKKMLREP